ncbi:Post-GPI attachment to proteins factor [Dirofilaria immitis]
MQLFYRLNVDRNSQVLHHHPASGFTFGILPLFLGTMVDYFALYNQEAYFSVSSRAATYFFSSFPLIGLCFCIFFALYSDFEKATETHCRIHNVLPSISVAIGDFYWGKMIWRILIFIHLVPRILVAFAYAQLFKVPLETVRQCTFRYLTCFLNLLELFCLAILSAISSKDNHFRHALAFCIFQMAGMIHGALHIIMYRITGICDYSTHTRKSYRMKKAYLISTTYAFLYFKHRPIFQTEIMHLTDLGSNLLWRPA